MALYDGHITAAQSIAGVTDCLHFCRPGMGEVRYVTGCYLVCKSPFLSSLLSHKYVSFTLLWIGKWTQFHRFGPAGKHQYTMRMLCMPQYDVISRCWGHRLLALLQISVVRGSNTLIYILKHPGMHWGDKCPWSVHRHTGLEWSLRGGTFSCLAMDEFYNMHCAVYLLCFAHDSDAALVTVITNITYVSWSRHICSVCCW